MYTKFKSLAFITACCSVLLALTLTGCNSKKKILFASEYVTLGNDVEPLIAIDSNAKNCLIKENDYANFLFTNKQKADILNVFEKKGSAAISVRVQIQPSEKQQVLLYSNGSYPFYFGFLTTEDFESNGDLKKNSARMVSNITVQVDEAQIITDKENPKKLFEVNMAVGLDQYGKPKIPEGIFVYSAFQCEIRHIDVDEAAIGFDYSNPAFPVYGFAPNGGIVNPVTNYVDFSGGSLIFPINENNVPEIEITLSDEPNHKSKDDAYVYINIQAGNDKFQINNVESAEKLSIPVSILKNKFPRVDITENKVCVKALKMKGMNSYNKFYDDVLTPLKADPGLVLKYNMSDWRLRDYEVFQWDRYPEILLFDFRDFDIQERFFKRMAFFVEKTGYKGRLVTNYEMDGLHGFNANDYKAEDFARFYNLAEEQHFKLNPEELVLKKYLINNGILILQTDGSVLAGKGGIASVSRQSGSKTESRLFVHEVLHTLFFIDEGFRNYVAATYEFFDPNTKQFLIDYFDANPQWNYDTNDMYLMQNEYMSYIMEHKITEVGPFFVDRATNYPNVTEYTPDLCEYIRETNARGFVEASRAMESYTFEKFGLKAGNVGLILKN